MESCSRPQKHWKRWLSGNLPVQQEQVPAACDISKNQMRAVVKSIAFCSEVTSWVIITAISALIFEGKFPILEARSISEQSRWSARPGRENGCACRVDPSNARATKPRSAVCPVVWGALLHAFFSLLAMKQFKSVCQGLFFACRSVHCVSFTCMDCVGNVCEAKEVTDTRLFRRSSPQLTSHLHKSYCFFPSRSVCAGTIQGKENLKYFCLSTTAKRGISAMKRSPACVVRQWPEASTV